MSTSVLLGIDVEPELDTDGDAGLAPALDPSSTPSGDVIDIDKSEDELVLLE